MDKKLKNFVVNGVQVDAIKNFIIRNGEKIDISPKQIRLLQCLVQNQERVVAYDELESCIDIDKSSHAEHAHAGTPLYQHIASLRKALGDSISNPTFIKTISKEGYQFIGELSFSKHGLFAVTGKWWAALAAATIVTMVVLLLQQERAPAPGAENSYERMVSDLSQKLAFPKRIIGLEHKAATGGQYQLLQNAIELVAKYHLEQQSGSHVSIVPEFNARKAYDQLREHFDAHSELTHILQPEILQEKNRVFIRVIMRAADNHTGKDLVNIDITGLPPETALSRYELELIAQLQALSLIPPGQKAQLKNPSSSALLVTAADVRLNEFNHWRVLEQSIQNIHKAI
jgi:DNA-binding winged helix-turn-helix (wHTH) protein